jgi:DNA-3-methyladenine glycosylase II
MSRHHTLTPEVVAAGVKHLHRSDRVLRGVIDAAGPFALKPRRDRFSALSSSILSQQISTSAADSIKRKLKALLAPNRISAETLAGYTPEELRTAGVSPQKAGYLLDLARKVNAGEVRLGRVHLLSDDEVIEELVKIKGVGVWTAHMFLMFSLGRADVFPHGDLGVRMALRNLYGLKELPAEREANELAAPWRPYATIASWYCWRSLDLRKAEGK